MSSPWHLARCLLAALLFICLAASALAAAPVAMITDLKGRAQLASPAPGKPLAILAELPAGAEIVLEPGTDLTMVYIGSGHEFRVTGTGRISIGPQLPVFSGQGRLASSTSLLSSIGGRLNTDGGRVVQGALVMRGAGERLRQIAPRQKTIDERPAFQWVLPEALRGVAFELRDDVQVLAAAEVAGDSYTLPAGVTLVPGKTYTWRISPLPGEGTGQLTSSFMPAMPDERQRMHQIRPDRGASFSDQVLYALVLEQAGFAGEAMSQWRALSEARPQDASLRARWAR